MLGTQIALMVKPTKPNDRSMYFALYNGGPRAWFFSYIIVFTGVLFQAASLAEMASIQPVAGAQYHWTWVSMLFFSIIPFS